MNRQHLKTHIHKSWRKHRRNEGNPWRMGLPSIYAIVRIRPKLKRWAKGRDQTLLHILTFSRDVVKPFVEMGIGHNAQAVDCLVRVFQGYDRIPSGDAGRAIKKAVRDLLRSPRSIPLGLKDAWGIVPFSSKEIVIKVRETFQPRDR